MYTDLLKKNATIHSLLHFFLLMNIKEDHLKNVGNSLKYLLSCSAGERNSSRIEMEID